MRPGEEKSGSSHLEPFCELVTSTVKSERLDGTSPGFSARPLDGLALGSFGRKVHKNDHKGDTFVGKDVYIGKRYSKLGREAFFNRPLGHFLQVFFGKDVSAVSLLLLDLIPLGVQKDPLDFDEAPGFLPMVNRLSLDYEDLAEVGAFQVVSSYFFQGNETFGLIPHAEIFFEKGKREGDFFKDRGFFRQVLPYRRELRGPSSHPKIKDQTRCHYDYE